MKQILSFDLHADFGFFKKPDVNDNKRTPYLSYNMLHKPALLGILGAIVGFKGYEKRGVLPEYYQRLKHLPVGIAPVPGSHEQGNFVKTTLTFNNSVGYASQEKGGNLMITEHFLMRPAYRCYLLLDDQEALQAKLLEYLQEQKAEFLPYFGKNEHAVWWNRESVKSHEYRKLEKEPEHNFEMLTLFSKEAVNVREQQEATMPGIDLFAPVVSSFAYFERLPVSFDEQLFQYRMRNFVFTNFKLKPGSNISNLYHLPQANGYVQLI